MISDASSHSLAPARFNGIVLTIVGIGHVPSFKNSKQLFVTNPRCREWMRKATDSFALQLLCEFQTRGGETQMGLSRPSWIASVVPLDDSVQWIVEETIRVMLVPKGQEGAEILITPVPEPDHPLPECP